MIEKFISATNFGINKALDLDPQKIFCLKHINKKLLYIVINDLDMSLYVLGNEFDITICKEKPKNFNDDCLLEGNYNNLIKMLISKDPQSYIKTGIIKQEGSLSVLRSYDKFFKCIKIDFESIINSKIGIIPGNLLISPIKNIKKSVKERYQLLIKNTNNYLIEESEHLVGIEELNDYYEDIYKLKTHLDRVDAKIKLYKSLIKTSMSIQKNEEN